MILSIPIMIFIILSVLLFIMDTVQSVGEENIIPESNIPKDFEVILVLGTGMESSEDLSDMLVDRLNKVINLSMKVKDAKILLSGNSGRCHFDEAAAMKRYIMKVSDGIKEESIFMDHEGFSVYESIYRAKAVFKVRRMIIITNYYNLPRALYIAAKLNIKAFGVFSDSKDYENIDIYRERELLAQVKDFVYVTILKPRHKCIEEVPINICRRKLKK